MERTEIVFWGIGFVLSASLFVMLASQRRDSEKWFTAWIGFGCANSAALFLVSRLSVPHLYFLVYWIDAFLDLLLQLGVVYEVARAVLTRKGQWVAKSGDRLGVYFCVGVVASVVVSFTISPAAGTVVDVVFARANLFMTVLFCSTFGTVVLLSMRCGVGWRGRPAKLVYGLVVWNLVSFCTDTLHTYWSTIAYFTKLEYIRDASFIVVLIYWITVPSRGDVSIPDQTGPSVTNLPELRDQLLIARSGLGSHPEQ